MQFTKEFKAGIRAGAVTRSYRVWKKPQAKVGGRYNLHPDGVIEVTGISQVAPADITDQGAIAAKDAPAVPIDHRFVQNLAWGQTLEFGIRELVNAKMSEMMRIDGPGG